MPSETPFQELARKARELAELADELGGRNPIHLAPTDMRNPLAELDQAALAVRAAVAACRVHTYAVLQARGLSVQDIAARWRVVPQAIRNVLRRSA